MSGIVKGKNPRKPHTVRFWVDGRQRERSFATANEAKDYKIKVDHDTRAKMPEESAEHFVWHLRNISLLSADDRSLLAALNETP